MSKKGSEINVGMLDDNKEWV